MAHIHTAPALLARAFFCSDLTLIPRMFVHLSAPGHRAATGALMLAALLQAAPALSQGNKPRRATHAAATTPPAAAPPPAALHDGQAETRLIAVYQLAAAGRSREALAQAAAARRWRRPKAWRATTPTFSWRNWPWRIC